MESFQLGPLQKLWINQLRKYYERQISGHLGHKNSDGYRACCLGELHLCWHRIKKLKLPFNNDGSIFDENIRNIAVLAYSYDIYYLNCPEGSIREEYRQFFGGYPSLSAANDDGMDWVTIAYLVEKYPQAVFTKSI